MYQARLREALKRDRAASNWSLRDLSQATGISASTLSRFENGATNISGDILLAIEDYLGFGMKSDMEKFEEAEEQAAKEQRSAEVVALARDLLVHGRLDRYNRESQTYRLTPIDIDTAFSMASTFFNESEKRKANGEI